MNIKGRYVQESKETTQGEWSVEQIQQMIQQNHSAMLHLSGYYIDSKENYAKANGLTLFPNESEIFEQDGFIVVPTYFREYKLPSSYRTGNDEQLVKVNCLIDKQDKYLTITLVKHEEKSAI